MRGKGALWEFYVGSKEILIFTFQRIIRKCPDFKLRREQPSISVSKSFASAHLTALPPVQVSNLFHPQIYHLEGTLIFIGAEQES